VKVSVAVYGDQARPEVEYTLTTLLEVVGLPFELLRSPTAAKQPGTLRLDYGPPAGYSPGDVVIPADDLTLWHTAEPAHVAMDGVPALYTGEEPKALLYHRDASVFLGFDLVLAAFWLLSRQEELGDSDRDAMGRFVGSKGWLMRRDLAETPIVNLYAALLETALWTAAQRQDVPLVRKGQWPYGQRYTVVLSHDVDEVGRFEPGRGVRLFMQAFGQSSARAIARGAYFAAAGLSRSLAWWTDPYWNFDAITSLESQNGFRSTFFFVPEARSVSRDPPYEIDTARMRDLLARLRAGGWELGVHGNFDSSMDAGLLRSQRQRLERVGGAAVHGIRQHYLQLRVPDSFRAQAMAGFAYDSSLGYHDCLGFRAGAAFPFHPYDLAACQPLPLLELPLTVMDGPLFWDLGLTPQEATTRTLALLDTVQSQRGLAVLLWHQRVWNAKKYPGWAHVFQRVVEHLRDEGEAWVATAGSVAHWWLARESVRLEEAMVESRVWRWRYRANQAISGLTLTLAGAGGGKVTVVGAEPDVRVTGQHEIRLEFNSLDSGQAFEIVLSRGETP
jgi:hypothetical protein